MPLPIYFGLCIHTLTKSEKIICILDSLEITEVMNMSLSLKMLTSAVSKQLKDQGVVACMISHHKI